MQLIHDNRGLRRRNCESDPDVAAIRGEDRGIDTDNFAVHVEQRTARITLIDRCIDLNKVVIGPGVNIAAPGRYNAGCRGIAEPERIADGDNLIADPGGVGFAERDIRKSFACINLQKSKVGFRIDSFEVGRILFAIV